MSPPPELSRDLWTWTRTPSFEVSVDRSWSYPVVFEPGCLAHFGALLAREVGPAALFVLSDERVHGLYGAILEASLRASGYDFKSIRLPPGERSKSMGSYVRVLEELARLECDRRAVLVNFGGGVISDLGGFVASSYMRGIRYVNLSTSLLGQIDACVGGKVAISTHQAKNLVGAFHHPSLVVGDPALLATLEEREFRAGLAEGIKVAILGSPELFERFEHERAAILQRRPRLMTEIIREATRLKMEWIARDPYEENLERPLNLGHTLGHPIETELAYENILHGEAVAIGMGVATTIALERNMIELAQAERIWNLLAAYDLLGCHFHLEPKAVVKRVRYVRLVRARALNFVLPQSIGSVAIVPDLSDAELVAGIEAYRSRAAELQA